MIEFVLFSRRGRTDGNFRSLREAGRLDVVHECLLTAFFTSGTLRRDVVFHAVLGGPPRPPVHLTFDGVTLRDVRTDEKTWEDILRKVLSGRTHSGIELRRESFQEVLKSKRNVFVLEEGGEDIQKAELGEDPVFVLGDQVGLPRQDERFALRSGTKVSLGKKPYLAASCVDIINYILDRRSART